jgi:hypothetical protein
VPFGGKEKTHMAAKPDHKLYQYHVSNLRSIEIAIKNTALSARKAIAEQNLHAIKSFVRLFSFLIGAWAETRLSKLLFEKNGIAVDDRNTVLSQPTQLERWHKFVEIAFRRKYAVPAAPLSDSTLPHAAYARYTSLVNILNTDLRSIIEIRNKLAHGQWVYPLNNEENDVETEKYNNLRQENLLGLQFKKDLLSNLAFIIHDLIVSLPTFERDFDLHYKQIIATKINLQKRSYEKYSEMMIAKRQRGIEKRRHNF